MEHEWFAEQIDRSVFDLRFVLFNSKNSELQIFLLNKGFEFRNYPLPHKLWMLPYYLFFAIQLLIQRPAFVHCHLFHASLIGILAAKLAGIKKRIYTRHHSDLHHTYHPHAVKYDLLINKMATHIIAVSSNVKEILVTKENTAATKVTVIPHGLPAATLSEPISEERIEKVRRTYNYGNRQPVIGIISRFVEFKGIHYSIPAFKDLLKLFPNALLVLANAGGSYENEINALLEELPADRYLKIKFESDAPALLKSFDAFVHTPVNSTLEAFGQVYIEAMTYGVPIVCTKSGIACEVLIDKHNALICDYRDSVSILDNLARLLTFPELPKQLIKHAKADVREFTFEQKLAKLSRLYKEG